MEIEVKFRVNFEDIKRKIEGLGAKFLESKSKKMSTLNFLPQNY